jgi:hypothetical protein
MSRVWMGIVPGPKWTRVLVIDETQTTLLKARLPAEPRHPRAVETLCEAVALWCGRKVLAALAADNPDPSSATKPWLDTFDAISRSPLCEIRFTAQANPPSDVVTGLGDFKDVYRLLLFEVER